MFEREDDARDGCASVLRGERMKTRGVGGFSGARSAEKVGERSAGEVREEEIDGGFVLEVREECDDAWVGS